MEWPEALTESRVQQGKAARRSLRKERREETLTPEKEAYYHHLIREGKDAEEDLTSRYCPTWGRKWREAAPSYFWKKVKLYNCG